MSTFLVSFISFLFLFSVLLDDSHGVQSVLLGEFGLDLGEDAA
jgi:hypothetical protein